MKRGLRIVLLAIIFVVAVFVFFILLNRESPVGESSEEQAEIPLIYMEQDGQWINELHGYRTQMSEVSMRDTILPMPEDDVLHLRIDTEDEVTSVSYEITSLDGETQAASGTGKISGDEATITLTDNLARGSDGILVLSLEAGGEEYYYYSRLANFSDAHVTECMAFVKELHDITRDPTRSNELTGRMEPTAAGTEEGLYRVTIHSSIDQICWGDFSCTQLREPQISIKEITNSYSVYVLDYPVVYESEDGAEYLNVREAYRVRYSQDQVYLLDFERVVSEIFTGGTESGGDRINLGLRSSDVDYAVNQSGTTICFVQEGDLWSYDTARGEMVRVFSFRGEDLQNGDALTDVRGNYGEHEIRTIRIDETGNIDFIVYGYMNSGWHAGEVGISVCHYDSVEGIVKELLFLPQQASYQQLKENVGDLMYVSDAGTFYFSAGTSLYRVEPTSGDVTQLYSNVRRNFCVSDNGRYLVWTDSESGKNAEVMYVTDLETETTTDIPAGAGHYIQPLGFLGGDFLYGTAGAEDVAKGAAQNIFPMETVSIIDAADPQTVIKTYNGEGNLFSAVQISSEGSVTLECVYDKGTSYVSTDALSIKNNELLKEGRVSVIYLDSAAKQTEIGLSLKETIPEEITQKQSALSSSANAVICELPADVFASGYYVYAKGYVIGATADAGAAVRLADTNGGVVVDASQCYIWNRAKMLSQNKIELQQAGGNSGTAQALNVMLAAMGATAKDTDALLAEGSNAFDILKDSQGDGLVLNLSGCSLDEILYYIGRGYPAYAVAQDGVPVLVYGYDSTKVQIFWPADGATTELTLQEASEQFAAEGNIFYVYQKQI